MKKLGLFIFIIAIAATEIKAQTNISGFINANTTWNLAGSPYIVIGNALVSHGYTLTINPGVVIKFDSAKALQIDGELIAIGTSQNRITFTSNKPIPHAGDWAKIHFADTCVNAVFDIFGNYISGCIMKYCDVLYGGGLGYGEIHIESSSPYISHCNILNSSADGIDCIGSSYLLDSSAVKNCNGNGLYFDNISQNSCGLKIKGDTIENNFNGGIIFYSGAGMCLTTIANNYFISNKNYGAINALHAGFNSISIYDNYFINNSDSASHDGILVIGGWLTNDTINCNRFINNHCYNAGGCLIVHARFGMIANNIFENNICNGPVSYLAFLSDGNFFFSNNYFANNSSSSYTGISYFVDESMSSTPDLYVDHNTYVNNIGQNVVYIAQGQPMNNSNLNFLYFKHNNFFDPGAQYELCNNLQYGSPNIYADSNYWGSTNTAHIDSVIYDYFDYANQSVVYYLPILNTSVEIDTTCVPPDIITNIISTKINTVIDIITIFPNPAIDKLTIETPPHATIQILSIHGQLIKTLAASGNKTNIDHVGWSSYVVDVSALPAGMYIVQVKTEKGVAVGKFLKE